MFQSLVLFAMELRMFLETTKLVVVEMGIESTGMTPSVMRFFLRLNLLLLHHGRKLLLSSLGPAVVLRMSTSQIGRGASLQPWM